MAAVADFGKEDFTFLTKGELKSMLVSHFRGILRLIKTTYFNDLYPQNQTVQFKMEDSEHLWVSEDGTFRPLPTEYVLDTIIISAWERLVNLFYEIDEQGKMELFKKSLLSIETFERIETFVYQYGLLCHGIPSAINEVKRDALDLIKNISLEKATEKQKKKKKA